MPALVTRRRAAALAAALGAGAAMLMASPAVPASAAPAAPPPASAGQTVSVTAHPAAGGAIRPFSNPLDITCTFTIDTPVAGSGVVSAGSRATCTYDRDGTPANVQFLDLDDHLLLNTVFKDDQESSPSGKPSASTFVFAACQHGTWANTASLGVTFPAGYVPQTMSAAYTTTDTIAHCPGDPPTCLVSCPGSGGGPDPAVRAREPEIQPGARLQALIR